MSEQPTMRFVPGPREAKRMSTAELRSAFLVQNLFVRGKISLIHADLDRVVLGGAMPADEPLTLQAPPSLGAEFFAERREIGVLNIGAAGRVSVDGVAHALGKGDAIYIGRGARDITFASEVAADTARFYLVSYPAHAPCATAVVRRTDVRPTVIGSPERANQRAIARYVHPEGVRSAQLVMGVTTLAEGSVWNTMPPHTHHRRSEVYLYYDIPDDGLVVHLLGEPTETRHLLVRDGEAVLAPGWSIHCGCGTTSYSFCWAMGGENQVYTDMTAVEPGALR